MSYVTVKDLKQTRTLWKQLSADSSEEVEASIAESRRERGLA